MALHSNVKSWSGARCPNARLCLDIGTLKGGWRMPTVGTFCWALGHSDHCRELNGFIRINCGFRLRHKMGCFGKGATNG